MNESERLLNKINEISGLTIRDNSTKFFVKKKDAEKLAKSNNDDEDPKDKDRFVYIVKEINRPIGSKLGKFFVEIQDLAGNVIGKL